MSGGHNLSRAKCAIRSTLLSCAARPVSDKYALQQDRYSRLVHGATAGGTPRPVPTLYSVLYAKVPILANGRDSRPFLHLQGAVGLQRQPPASPLVQILTILDV